MNDETLIKDVKKRQKISKLPYMLLHSARKNEERFREEWQWEIKEKVLRGELWEKV